MGRHRRERIRTGKLSHSHNRHRARMVASILRSRLPGRPPPGCPGSCFSYAASRAPRPLGASSLACQSFKASQIRGPLLRQPHTPFAPTKNREPPILTGFPRLYNIGSSRFFVGGFSLPRCPPSLGEHTGTPSPSVKAALASLGGSAGLDPRARVRSRGSVATGRNSAASKRNWVIRASTREGAAGGLGYPSI